ncbi:MAG: glycosyltransferase family 4 protein [Candidatus Niyogibacteria bacterium]|nr:glycosyltransferase family 4 protein [Candidatus Niyogibacteria bacterium]
MRIILITSKLNFETAGGSVLDLHWKAKSLQDEEHDVTVVTAFSRANKISIDLPYKVVEENIAPKGTLLSMQSGIYGLLKKYESAADAFYIDGHMFLYGGGLYRMLGGLKPVAAFFNVRLNCWADMTGNPARVSFFKTLKKKIRSFMERRIGIPMANHLDAFIFNTPMVEKMYVDFGVDSKKTSVIEDFVDMKGIIERHHIMDEFVERRQRSCDIIQIFCTGRMFPEKGFDLVIKAFATLSNKEKYRVVMSGGGPDKERLESMVRDLGLGKYFSFPGWVAREKMFEFFLATQIFVFPKWWMEYGSALLTEAMAFGIPCIIPGGGALEWLTAGSALTFNPNDHIDLAKKIEKLGKDEGLRIKLSKDILVRAQSLDYRVLGRKLNAVIESLV